MKKEKNRAQIKEPSLSLLEYTRHSEDFSAFEGFDHYFTHCLQTCGEKMHVIAQWMNLSATALSIRMNQVDTEQPRFNVKHVDLYVTNSGDPRPSQYIEWRAKRAQVKDQDALMEKLARLLPHMKEIRELCDALEGK